MPLPNEKHLSKYLKLKKRRREKVDPRNARFISKNKRTLAKITGELLRKHGSASRRACKDVVV